MKFYEIIADKATEDVLTVSEIEAHGPDVYIPESSSEGDYHLFYTKDEAIGKPIYQNPGKHKVKIANGIITGVEEKLEVHFIYAYITLSIIKNGEIQDDGIPSIQAGDKNDIDKGILNALIELKDINNNIIDIDKTWLLKIIKNNDINDFILKKISVENGIGNVEFSVDVATTWKIDQSTFKSLNGFEIKLKVIPEQLNSPEGIAYIDAYN